MTTVKCKNCGADIPGNMKFCTSCGAPLNQAAPEEYGSAAIPKVKVPFKLKKLIIPIVVLAAIITGCIIAGAVIPKPQKYAAPQKDISIFNINNKSVVILNGVVQNEINGWSYCTTSLDKSITGFLLSARPESYDDIYEDMETLYIFDSELRKISDYVSSYVLSDGGGVAFVSEVVGKVGKLCLYFEGEITTLEENFYISNDYQISPDGKTVIYGNSDGSGEVYGFYYDGQRHELGKGVEPVAIANEAKLVYYVKNDKFYVQKGDNKDNRENLGRAVSVSAFNKDYTQVLYKSDDDSNLYISQDGKPEQIISESVLEYNALVPYGIGSLRIDNRHGMAYGYGLSGDESMWCYSVVGVDSFKNTYFKDFGSVCYIDNDFKASQIIISANTVKISNDGKTIFFSQDDGIYKIIGSNKNAEAVKLAEEDIVNFYPADDGKAVYFLTDNGDLYYQKGTGKPVLVSDELSVYYYDIAVFNNLIFYTVDSELYSSSGSKGTLVDGINCDVSSVSSSKYGVTVEAYDNGDARIYYSRDGKTFELIYSE